MNYTIRPAVIDDLDNLVDLAVSTFKNTYTDLTQEQLDHHNTKYFTKSVLHKQIDDPEVLILVAESDSLAGYAQFIPNSMPGTKSNSDSIELFRLHLINEYQSHGIGTELLEQGLKWSKEKHFKTCWLIVWDQNTEAIKFYNKRGFKITGETSYTESGLDDRVLIMYKQI